MTDTLALAGRSADQLSVGERARVLLARALAVEAPGLLVDEPIAMLDPYHQLDVLGTLRAYAAGRDLGSKRLVVVVLHDLGLAARFCDRVDDVMPEPFTPSPGEAVFYLVTGESLGVEGSLGTGPSGERPNAHPCPICDRPFTPILYTSDSNKSAQTLVIDNLAGWCSFWPAACSAGLVDFSSEVALVSAIGSRPNTCYSVAITCVKQNGAFDNLAVTYVESCPQSGSLCFQVITTPMHVVKVPRPVAGAAFTRTTVGPCP